MLYYHIVEALQYNISQPTESPMLRILPLCLLAFPALAEVPSVVTDIPPVGSLVAQVLGDLGQPVVLLDKGADEHELALKPSQMAAVSGAGLVVWVGPELTHELGHALEAVEAPKLALLPLAETQDYAEGGVNPHAWLSPGNAKLWLAAIAGQLSQIDPDHAATYAANAAAAAERVDALDAELKAKLAGVKPFVTWHDAYGYYATAYGLPYLGGLASGEAHDPGAASVAALATRVEAGEVACLFPEAQHDPAMLTAIADKAMIGGALDPVGSDLDPVPGAWAELMTRLADGIATCR